MKTIKYIPINCSLYDQLEAFSVLKTPLRIEFSNTEVVEIIEEAFITDFKTQKDGEFAFISSGPNELKLRLDKIISINGTNVKDKFGVSCSISAVD